MQNRISNIYLLNNVLYIRNDIEAGGRTNFIAMCHGGSYLLIGGVIIFEAIHYLIMKLVKYRISMDTKFFKILPGWQTNHSS